ncbi:MAG TPA: S41 family peptidase [Vicinamibacterales bacterium]|nr:S41 family peptidase [Vicinamibacterales bacterium]
MTFRTRLTVLLISTPVLAFVLVGGLIGKTRSGDQQFQHLRVFDDVVSLVLNNYVEEVKVDRVMEGAMRGLADGLDADSAYLTPRQVRAIESGEAQPEGDVGLELTRQYYLRVIAARDGSSAAKAGLQTGDYVRAIDGKPTRDMSVFEGSRLLRGQPGSKVTLTVIRGNAADPHEVVLVREKVSGPQITSRLMGDAGYVRIAAFRNGVAEDLRRQVADLTKGGAKSLVIDIRRTAEGPLDNGIAAARLFVKSGTLAIKAGREGQGQAKETITANPGDGSIELPVTLLVTTGTSGAAELFAAALDGNKRAELVGERTLGRAAVQKLVKLPEYRGLWLTYARYLRPTGEPIHGKGLEPDLQIEEPDVEFGAAAPETDPILDAALERLRSRG